MSKIYFKYGTMGSGKSMELIRTYYNYVERGMKAIIFKSGLDNRDGDITSVSSRAGLKVEAIPFFCLTKVREAIIEQKPNVILFDECQFLKEEEVDGLRDLCYEFKIPLIFYGLKTDFQSKMFTGSKRILEIADDVQQCIGICSCGRKAHQNMRLYNGIPIFHGQQVQIGGNESYIAVCNRCYYNFSKQSK